MKVVLVNPGFLKGGMAHFFRAPPLGLLYLAGGILEVGDHSVKILDFPVQTYNHKQLLSEFNHADVVGVSCLTSSFVKSKAICHVAKEAGATTIMGGFQPSLVPDIAKFPEVDAVVRGEGELTMKDIIQKMMNGENWQQSLGVSYFDKDTESVVHMPDRPLAPTLDDLPIPAYNLIDTTKYQGFGVNLLSMETSRGCSFGCNFCCVAKVYGRSWRPKSIDRVITELKLLPASAKHLFMVDDNYVMNGKRAIELSKRLVQEGIDKRYIIQARADTLARNPKLIDWLAMSGVRCAFLGIESMHPASLKAMNKGLSQVKLVEEAIETLHKRGIAVWASIITGVEPSFIEGRQALETTLDFLQDHMVEVMQCTPITAYPGTEYYNQAVENGWVPKYDLDDPEAMELCPDRLDFPRKGIKRLTDHAYGYFYLTPRYLRLSKWKNFTQKRWFWLYRIIFNFIPFVLKDFLGNFVFKNTVYEDQDFSKLATTSNPTEEQKLDIKKQNKLNRIMNQIDNFQRQLMKEIQIRKAQFTTPIIQE